MAQENLIDSNEDLYTESWLQAAQSSFEQAVIEDDLPLAVSIASDIREAGYEREATALMLELEGDKEVLI